MNYYFLSSGAAGGLGTLSTSARKLEMRPNPPTLAQQPGVTTQQAEVVPTREDMDCLMEANPSACPYTGRSATYEVKQPPTAQEARLDELALQVGQLAAAIEAFTLPKGTRMGGAEETVAPSENEKSMDEKMQAMMYEMEA